MTAVLIFRFSVCSGKPGGDWLFTDAVWQDS